MDAAIATPSTPNYGLDSPKLVRNLFLLGAAALLFWASSAVHLWSGLVYNLPIAKLALSTFSTATLTALWMVWRSRIGKFRARDRFLNRIQWRGDEKVLDVGCGRGLMLIGAAKRLTTGKAIGVDIWEEDDLSGNRRDAVVLNARQEGVADRVEVATADMRKLPFADGSMDVVVSCGSIHMLKHADERAQAVREIARVLKPGGAVLIDDVLHTSAYAATLKEIGFGEIRWVGSKLLLWSMVFLTFGGLRPDKFVGRKAK